jgi:hypothetical protein
MGQVALIIVSLVTLAVAAVGGDGSVSDVGFPLLDHPHPGRLILSVQDRLTVESFQVFLRSR